MYPNIHHYHFHTMKTCVALANLRWRINKNIGFRCVTAPPLFQSSKIPSCWLFMIVFMYTVFGEMRRLVCVEMPYVYSTKNLCRFVCGCYLVCSFMFLNIHPLPFPHDENLCCISKSMMKHQQKSDSKSESGAWLAPLFTSHKSPFVGCSWLCLYMLFLGRWDDWCMWRCPTYIVFKTYVCMWMLFGLFFHVPQLPPTTFQHNDMCVCISKSMMKHQQKKVDSKSDFSSFS